VEPFLVATAVNVAAAQRLVRKICAACKEAYRPNAEEAALFAPDPPPEVLYRGRGCKACRNIGYSGRMALYEVFWVNAPIRRMVLDGADADTVRQRAVADGMVTLRQTGFRRALQGQTTVEEIMAVVADQE
jgi:type II secretory ATPase GspE/PulE/Tfp pilus assembly ATPase PilB-like protein